MVGILMMQRRIINIMTNKQAFIVAAEKAGIMVQKYLADHDENDLCRAMSYIRAANVLIKEMTDEID